MEENNIKGIIDRVDFCAFEGPLKKRLVNHNSIALEITDFGGIDWKTLPGKKVKIIVLDN